MIKHPTIEELKQRVKNLEQSLQNSRQIETLLMESAQEGIVIVQNGKIVYANPEALNLNFFDEKDLNNLSFVEVIHPDDRKLALEQYDKIINGKTSRSEQSVKILDQEGHNRWFQVRNSRIEWNNQPSIISFITDVTRLKNTEDKLKESEEEIRIARDTYRNIFLNSQVGMFRTNLDGMLLDANDHVAKLIGFKNRAELMAEPFSIAERYVVPEDREKMIALLQQHGEFRNFETFFRRNDDTHIIMRYSAKIVPEKGWLEGVSEDITTQYKMKEALRESEEKYRLVVENANDAIFVAQDKRIKFANRKCGALTGHSINELSNMPFVDIIHTEDRDIVMDKHRRRLKGEEIASTYMFKIVTKSGSEKIVQINTVLIQWEERPAALIFLRDITQQTKIEAQLQQAQKMESIGTLAGGIAHDFNNILSGIFGYTQLLQMKMEQNHEMYKYLDSIYKAGNRAKDLVQQILTFSRQTVNELNPMKIQGVIKEALKLIESSLPSTISIHREIQNNCGLVLADNTQIHQVLMNLCTNAYHAMEETGGVLTVNLNEVTLSVEDIKDQVMSPGEYVRLKVADTGPGMDQSITERIFEPYFTTKEEGKGTGMGLAVIHGIVKSHGGHISVYSETGKGSEFHVYLPVIKGEGEPVDSRKRGPLVKGSEQILLVDDEKEVVDIEQQMLEALGYRITVKTSSIDALETLRAQPDKFDLVITDMTMPNMTGDKLASEIMKIRSELPVLLCTGFSEQMSEEKSEALGIKGFLMKPVLIGELSSLIRKVLDNH